MTVSPPTIDATRSLQIAAEITRAGMILHNAYLQGQKERLLALYQEYKSQDQPFARVDFDAVLVGFREDWMKGNYPAIVRIGGFIPPSMFADNREAEAYYIGARNRTPPR